MGRTGIGYIVLALLAVAGLFAFASWDQTNFAAAKTQAEIRMGRQPEAVETVVDLGMTVGAKVISGALASLLLAGVIFAYQQARINELKNGGWERFWQRRNPPKSEQVKTKKPSLAELVTMLLLRDANRNDRNH